MVFREFVELKELHFLKFLKRQDDVHSPRDGFWWLGPWEEGPSRPAPLVSELSPAPFGL